MRLFMVFALLSSTWAYADGMAPALSAGSAGPDTTLNLKLEVLLRTLVQDRELSQADVGLAFGLAGKRVSPSEMLTLRDALAGKVRRAQEFTVEPQAKKHAARAVLHANLNPTSLRVLEDRGTFSGGQPPAAVQAVVVKAKLNGARLYSPTEKQAGRYLYAPPASVFPPASHASFSYTLPATEGLTFEWTQITPEAVLADKQDTGTRLKREGSFDRRLARFTTTQSGTGRIASEYHELLYPVTKDLLETHPQEALLLQYGSAEVSKARGPTGNRWAGAVAVLSDGTIHCLPASRRHRAQPHRPLVNSDLARGHELMWTGHVEIEGDRVKRISSSGRIASLAARGTDVFLNPIPLFEAWGFSLDEGVSLLSGHETLTPQVSHELAVQWTANDPAQGKK